MMMVTASSGSVTTTTFKSENDVNSKRQEGPRTALLRSVDREKMTEIDSVTTYSVMWSVGIEKCAPSADVVRQATFNVGG